MRSVVVSAFVALAIGVACSSAAAQTSKELAKQAYDRAVAAHERGDHRVAAEEFARADGFAPSPIALQAALDAAVEADEPVLGAELIERSARAPLTPALRASVEAATTKLGGRAGHLKVACPAGARCTAKVDALPVDPVRGRWVSAGLHELVITVDDQTDTRSIQIRAGEDLAVTAPSPGTPAVAPPGPSPIPARVPSPPAEAARKPLAPIVFWVAAGTTVVLAGASVAFALATKGKHDDFVERGCASGTATATTSCTDLKDQGESMQTLANVGLASTAVVGVASAVMGLFFTDWGGASPQTRAPVARAAVIPLGGGLGVSYGGRF